MSDQVVKDQLLLDREALRAQLNGYLLDFSLADRVRTKVLDKSTVSTERLANIVADDFASQIKSLERKLTDKNWRGYLMRHLSFDAIGADLAVSHLVEQRRHELIAETTKALGLIDDSQLVLTSLLTTPVDELVDLIQRFANYQQAINIEMTYGLSLLDAHAGHFKRSQMRRRIRRERKQIARQEKRTLRKNHRLIQEFLANDQLFADLIANQLSYVEILGLRQDYQKTIDKLKTNEREPSKLMDIFDDVTKTYIRREINRLSSDQQDLKTLNATNEQLRGLLLEVFDLDNEARNQLMTKMAEYNNLLRDNANITTARTNRAKLV
jgi:hypothetical protein